MAAASNARPYDVIAFGASGFTGRLCVKYLARAYPNGRWAVAGRNVEKLKQCLREYNADTKDVIAADCGDLDALRSMARQSRVVLTTAGPFHRYGNKLVEACVKEKTHYADITGETFWVKQLIGKWHEEAAQSGTRIVPFCGFDAIPSDILTYYAVRQMQTEVVHVEQYMNAKGQASGGTIETAFEIFKRPLEPRFALNPQGNAYSITPKQQERTSDSMKIVSLRKLLRDDDQTHKKSQNNELVSFNLPIDLPPSVTKEYSSEVRPKAPKYSGYSAFAYCNSRIVRRSAALLNRSDSIKGQQEPFSSAAGLASTAGTYSKDFTYEEHGGFYASRFSSQMSKTMMNIFGVAIKVPLLRTIIRSMLPKPGEGPSLEMQESGWFRQDAIAHDTKGNRKRFVLWARGDPGYKCTATMLCESAMALADISKEEENKHADDGPGPSPDPCKGGVLTPAAALGDRLVYRLHAAGLHFEGPYDMDPSSKL
mmetsp:Transcript_4306/g.15479  ORF Transcript_4306/g.15479 Transcript_4306/m.15479 type:complete len:482 (-) Transcript_4306:352-1797(-)